MICFFETALSVGLENRFYYMVDTAIMIWNMGTDRSGPAASLRHFQHKYTILSVVELLIVLTSTHPISAPATTASSLVAVCMQSLFACLIAFANAPQFTLFRCTQTLLAHAQRWWSNALQSGSPQASQISAPCLCSGKSQVTDFILDILVVHKYGF